MSGLDDKVENKSPGWTARMRPLGSFPSWRVKAFQDSIDAITGTRNGRPFVKLAWAPDELRWRPHKMSEATPGYTFPIFFVGWDEKGEEVAAPRWVLLERIEPEQFAPRWEGSRYTVYDGQVWDLKGPCPSERYTELRCHSYHDGECCPCHGDTCSCGEQYDHCWGKYLDPNASLLDWIRVRAWEARQDPDVQPTADARFFESPNAQREVASMVITAREKKKEEVDKFNLEMLDHWVRQPVSTTRQTESGLYLVD